MAVLLPYRCGSYCSKTLRLVWSRTTRVLIKPVISNFFDLNWDIVAGPARGMMPDSFSFFWPVGATEVVNLAVSSDAHRKKRFPGKDGPLRRLYLRHQYFLNLYLTNCRELWYRWLLRKQLRFQGRNGGIACMIRAHATEGRTERRKQTQKPPSVSTSTHWLVQLERSSRKKSCIFYFNCTIPPQSRHRQVIKQSPLIPSFPIYIQYKKSPLYTNSKPLSAWIVRRGCAGRSWIRRLHGNNR